jgi:hypothetical protein
MPLCGLSEGGVVVARWVAQLPVVDLALVANGPDDEELDLVSDGVDDAVVEAARVTHTCLRSRRVGR